MPCAKTAICLIALGLISVVSSLRAEVQTNPKCAEHGKGRAYHHSMFMRFGDWRPRSSRRPLRHRFTGGSRGGAMVPSI